MCSRNENAAVRMEEVIGVKVVEAAENRERGIVGERDGGERVGWLDEMIDSIAALSEVPGAQKRGGNHGGTGYVEGGFIGGRELGDKVVGVGPGGGRELAKWTIGFQPWVFLWVSLEWVWRGGYERTITQDPQMKRWQQPHWRFFWPFSFSSFSLSVLSSFWQVAQDGGIHVFVGVESESK
jgi:hypothetical protein